MLNARYFAVAIVLFALIDFVWLASVAQKFYQRQIGNLLLKKPNVPAAILFYLLFVVGLVLFAVIPHRTSGLHALGAGALFGLFTYGTYDLTNLATLKKWPVAITIVDMLWGVTLSSLVAAGSVIIGRHL